MEKKFRALETQVNYISIPDGSGGVDNVDVLLSSDNATVAFENRATHEILKAEASKKYKLPPGDYTVRVTKKVLQGDAVYADLTTKFVTCFRDQLPFTEDFELLIGQWVRVTGKNNAIKALIHNSTKRVTCLVDTSVWIENGKWKVQVDGALPNSNNPQITVQD